MANVGYATLQIIPSTLGFQKKMNAQLAGGMAASGVVAGKEAGKGASKGLAASSGLLAKGAKAGVGGAAAAIAAVAYGTLRSGSDFQKAMNQVRAVSGATGDDFEALKEQAKDLGSSTKFSATQAAGGMDFLARAGFDTKQIIGAMPNTLNLAAAANLDLASAADITSNILTGYGMKTRDLGKANDVLVKSFTSTNTDLNQLGEAFKYVGPVAKSAGVSFEETSAAIGLLGNAGIQGTMAGTALRSSITRLLNPVGQAKTAIQDLGLKTKDSEGNFIGFESIVSQLEESGASTSDVMGLFGQRAGPAMSALLDQGSDALKDQKKALEDVGGITDKVANQQMEGLSGAVTELKSAFEGLFITLSEKGVMDVAEKAIDGITRGVRGLTTMLDGSSESTNGFVVFLRDHVIPTARDFTGWVKNELWPAFKDYAQKVWNGFQDGIDRVGEAIEENRPFLNKVKEALQKVGDVLVEHVIPFLGDVAEKWFPILGEAIGKGITHAKNLTIALTYLVEYGAKAFRLLLKAALFAFDGILSAADKGLSWIPGIGDKISDANDAFDKFRREADADLRAVEGAARGLREEIETPSSLSVDPSGALAQIRRVRDAARGAVNMGSLTPRGFGAQQNATGGLISGPGTGTSDSILSWLSNGEYVIPANRVRQYGAGFFDALREGKFPGKAAPLSSAPSGGGSSSGASGAAARALIENLSIQGSGNVHDDLEEVFFQVRRLERGGR